MDSLNQEEEAFCWTLSQFPQRKRIQDRLTPFLRLYETASEFLDYRQHWLHGPLTSVDPDQVRSLRPVCGHLEITIATCPLLSKNP